MAPERAARRLVTAGGLKPRLEVLNRTQRRVLRRLAPFAHFDDAEREPSPRLLRRWSWRDIKATVRAELGALAG